MIDPNIFISDEIADAEWDEFNRYYFGILNEEEDEIEPSKEPTRGDIYCPDCRVGWKLEKEGKLCWVCEKEGLFGVAR